LFGAVRWPDGALLLFAAATTLGSLARQLPAQNVVLAAVVIGLAAGAAQTLGALSAVPFGPLVYNRQNIGQFLFNPLPWAVPIIWVVAILNSRGVARLMLRSSRRSLNYGFWVIGVSVLLVVLFDLSLEPYATQVKGYWAWKPTKLASDWYSTPWVNFLGWTVTSLVILLFVTPALISKSPFPPPPAYHPLLVWELLSFLCLSGAVIHHLHAATALIFCQMVLVAALSILGARSKKPQTE
jgi:putative membrane protein